MLIFCNEDIYIYIYICLEFISSSDYKDNIKDIVVIQVSLLYF